MEPFALEWLNLVVRVAHVIAAVMWIGDSFLFMWLDRNLVTPPRPREGDVVGELWMTHSGGFYEVVKRRALRPEELPAELHWFKWESYSTWITGAFLLVVVYYLGGAATLVDAGGPLTHGQAVALSLGLLAGGVAVYHLVCRTPLIERPALFGVLGLAAVMALAWGLGRAFTPRAVFLQLGAMLGTIMSSNVLLRIIPAQRHMLAATRAGQPVDTSHGKRAKQRSVHNHYLTLPVLFTMVSNHLPGVYGHAHAWLLLGLVFVFAAGMKHVMNERRRTPPAILAGTGAALAAAVALAAPRAAGAAGDAALAALPPVSFATVRQVLDARCVTCHAAAPTNPSFNAPPGGVVLETPAQVKAQAPRLLVRAVHTKTMPLGNLTGMTDRERELLGAWVLQGADVDAPGPSVVDAVAPPVAAPAPGVAGLFSARCAVCHGEAGLGDGPGAAALTPRPRAFADAAWQRTVTDEQLRRTILEGGAAVGKSSAMPPHPDLGKDEATLRALVAHLRSLERE